MNEHSQAALSSTSSGHHQRPSCAGTSSRLPPEPRSNLQQGAQSRAPPPTFPPTHQHLTSPAAPLEETTPRRGQGRRTGTPERVDDAAVSPATRGEEDPTRSAELGAPKRPPDPEAGGTTTPTARRRRPGRGTVADLFFHDDTDLLSKSMRQETTPTLSTRRAPRDEIPTSSRRRSERSRPGSAPSPPAKGDLDRLALFRLREL